MIRLDGLEVTDREEEWFVELAPNVVMDCLDENDARVIQAVFGGRVMRRMVFFTEMCPYDEST